MLRISLRNSSHLTVGSLEDLRSLIPEGEEGEALNYGQGEGQWRIGSTEWGIYCENDGCCFQLEEGIVEMDEAIRLAHGILERIRTKWGEQIRGEIGGRWHGDSFR
jgi:hypothetical protein